MLTPKYIFVLDIVLYELELKSILPPVAAVMKEIFLFNVIHMVYNFKNILAPPAAIYE